MSKAETKSKPCFCQSFECRGEIRSSRTVRRHADSDYQLLVEERNQVQNEYERTVAFDESIYESHSLAKQPLYEGSSLSTLEAIFIKIRSFVSFPSFSKEALTESFRTDHKLLLPQPNNMPESYEEAKAILRPFLIPLERYDVCVNDCCIFHNEHLGLLLCPSCNEPRFNANKTPRRTFTYFPLGPRLARIYGTKVLSQLLATADLANPVPSVIKDVQDTTTWKITWFGKDGLFKEKLGLALSFCTDGMNPFKAMGIQYSMWPLMTQVLNFPPEFRKCNSGIMLLGIIPSNGSCEPKSLEPFLSLVVEELKQLADATLYTNNTSKPLTVDVKLVEYILDFPAIAKLFKVQAQGGLKACPWCDTDGSYCFFCRKTVYLDNRRFLPDGHNLRTSISFPNGDVELRETPASFSAEDNIALRRDYENLPNNSQKSAFAKNFGLKGTYAFMGLDYHSFQEDYQPDGMHTLRRVAFALMSWLVQTKKNVVNVSKSVNEARLAVDPNIVYVLSREDKEIANERINALNFPAGFTACKGKVFNDLKPLKNHHGWQEYAAHNIWLFALRGCLPSKQQRTLTFFLAMLSNLLSESFKREELPQLKCDVSLALVLLERDFPPNLFNITTHILHHFIDNIDKFGPLYSSWMYPWERMNSWISRRCTNRTFPERCVMETYQLLDWVVYCTMAKKFERCEDPKNKICANAKKALVTTGEISADETTKKRKREVFVELSADKAGRIKDAINTDEALTTVAKLQYVGINDDTFKVKAGDFVTVGQEVAEVMEIFRYGKHEVVGYTPYERHHDTESGMTYITRAGSQNGLCYAAATTQFRPVVSATEDNKVWMLSIKPKLGDYSWLEEHIKQT